MKINKIKAFTLVELIVVITILAILGTIAFINLQGYSIGARDGKRLSDINNIMKKIGIEISKGTSISSLINTTKTNSGLTIDGNSGSSIQGTANFITLKEDGNSFKDPITKGDYIFSYSIGGTGTGVYKFTQASTVNEEENTAVVKGNYYLMQTGDSPSILKNNNNNFIVNEGVDLPYDITGTTPTTPIVTNSCDTQPNYTNASFTVGIPTTTNEVWQNTNNLNPCYYECINGFSGIDCSVFIGPTLNKWGDSTNTNMSYFLANRPVSDFIWEVGNSKLDTSVVKDLLTGLMRESVPSSTTLNWLNAKAYCANLSKGGFLDWRLPDVTEIETIIDYGKQDGNNHWYDTYFTVSSTSYYWSSTTYSTNTAIARILGFTNGYLSNGNKTSLYYVICVR